ncbi:MAG: hypothetical protein QG589_66 [Patescibacteria group bacterium]|nr:hypothetical protein [Patescibacteria group bacterium]
MKKIQVLSRLDTHIKHGKIRVKGEVAFAQFFHGWLENLTIPSDEKYDFYDIAHYLPQLAVDAWEAMRTGTDDLAVLYRQRYEQSTGRSPVNLMELGENILEQGAGINVLRYVLSAVVGERWIEDKVDAYCHAQSTALQGMFDKFLRLVYGQGLFEIIRDESERGMKGKFGSTELRTFVMAGRTMFTFARPKKKGMEVSITFVAGDDDNLALEAGIQSVEANLPTAFNMIEDVITRWPKTQEERIAIFKSNNKVAPLAVHVMRRAQAKEEITK